MRYSFTKIYTIASFCAFVIIIKPYKYWQVVTICNWIISVCMEIGLSSIIHSKHTSTQELKNEKACIMMLHIIYDISLE